MVKLWGVSFVHVSGCLCWGDLGVVCYLCLLNTCLAVNALTPDMSRHAESSGGVVAVSGFPRVTCDWMTILISIQGSENFERKGSEASIGTSR